MILRITVGDNDFTQELEQFANDPEGHPEVYRPTLLQFVRTVSGDAVPRTPGTWVHQGGPQGSQRTAASQICRAVECPASH